jgi:hypothetical protein
LQAEEHSALLDRAEGYQGFATKVLEIRHGLLHHLLEARVEGRRVVGYGAPAKGVTLLNYCGIGPDLLPYTVDRSPAKQGRYLPGCRIPIREIEYLLTDRPDEVLILPWNLRDEITAQMDEVRRWGGHFCVAIPTLERL